MGQETLTAWGSFSKPSYVPGEMVRFVAVVKSPRPATGVQVSLLILAKKPGSKTLYRRTISYPMLRKGATRVAFQIRPRTIGAVDGVYPVTLEVAGGDRTLRRGSRLVVVDPARHGPMLVSFVWNINDAAHITPQGVHTNGAAAAMVRGGRTPGYLAMHLSELERHRGVSANFNITPELLEELLGVAKGYTRRDGARLVRVGPDSPEAADARAFFARLVSQMRSGRIEFTPAPYAYPALPELTKRGWDADVQAQVGQGQDVIERALTLASTPGMLAPQLRLSTSATGILRRAGAEYTVVSARPGADKYGSAVIATDQARGLRVVFNDDVASRIVSAPRPPADVARDLVLHLARVRLGRARLPTAATIVLPVRAGWRPSAALLDSLYSAISSTRWIRTVTMGKAVAVTRSRARAVELPSYRLDRSLRPYYAHLAAARDDYLVYSRMARYDNPLWVRLRRNFLIAESANWTDEGRAAQRAGLKFADDVTRTVRAELAKISMPASQTITFPGTSGKVAVAVTNGTRYPLSVAVRLSGDKVGFPKGRLVHVQLQPGDNYLTFAVSMQTRGTAPVRVRVIGADRPLAHSVIHVRTTYFNRMMFLGVVVVVLVGVLVLVYRKAGAAGGR